MFNSIILSIQKQTDAIRSYKDDNRREFYLLIVILLIGAFLRLYRIDEYMTFLGDEGRDVIVVRRLLVDLDPILVGPGTSIGDMYLGPLYYYMMAPALLFANFSPVGPAVMVALLGVLTIAFVWYVGNQWFGKIAGMIAAMLYAVSPVVIRYSQSSWNPNIMPFFSLLTIWSIWRVWHYFEWKWLLITGISMAFVLQSHYLGLILLPVVGLFWLLSVLLRGGRSSDPREVIKNSLIGVVVFLVLMSPLVIFDARHGWRNFQAMKIFFTQRQTTVSARPWTAIPELFDHLRQITTTLLAADDQLIGTLLSYGFVLLFVNFVVTLLKKDPDVDNAEDGTLSKIYYRSGSRKNAPYTLIFTLFITALFAFGVYKQHIYAHYYGFLFPLPMLLAGGASEIVWKRYGKLGLSAVIMVLGILVFLNLSRTPINYPPNKQLQRTRVVAQKIADESGGEEFNLAVIAERNYEGAYQYFLEKDNTPIVMIDPQRAEETIAEQLFVVCELPDKECDPVNNEKAGIANFGWSKIDQKWSVGGTTLYRLVHVKH